MMERCKNISPFVLLMYEDVKRCAKMCGKARVKARRVPLPPIGETGTPAVIGEAFLLALIVVREGRSYQNFLKYQHQK